jgi:hypothetical protein
MLNFNLHLIIFAPKLRNVATIYVGQWVYRATHVEI